LCTPDIVKDFITQLEPTDLSGVAAVVGGLFSQDVLNTLGGRELPIKNWMIFDGRACNTSSNTSNSLGEGKIYNLMGQTNGEAKA
jgi:hypothetical protein